jgi:hypothetical protein
MPMFRCSTCGRIGDLEDCSVSSRLEFCVCCGRPNIVEGGYQYMLHGDPPAGWKPKWHAPWHCSVCAEETDDEVLNEERKARVRASQMLSAEHAEAGDAERAERFEREADDLRRVEQ